MPKYRLFVFGVVAALLAACAQPTIPDPEPTDTTYGDNADTNDWADGEFGSGEEVPYDPSEGELTHIIYFDFDSSEVRSEFTDVVARHALQLANRPSMQVRLEGHADERGSREYNIGLGERRSQSVRRMLLIQGASASQISTVSFGEERPVSTASNEAAWAQNRRVEIKYIN